MARDKKRKNFKQFAKKKSFFMALEIFVIIICMEFVVLQETNTDINAIIFTPIITIPIMGALISYFIFKKINIEEEKYRVNVDYVQHQVEEEKFVQVETSKENSNSLAEKVDLVAVQSKEEDTVIVAMSHNDDIISVRQLPIEQFKEKFNIKKS